MGFALVQLLQVDTTRRGGVGGVLVYSDGLLTRFRNLNLHRRSEKNKKKINNLPKYTCTRTHTALRFFFFSSIDRVLLPRPPSSSSSGFFPVVLSCARACGACVVRATVVPGNELRKARSGSARRHRNEKTNREK